VAGLPRGRVAGLPGCRVAAWPRDLTGVPGGNDLAWGACRVRLEGDRVDGAPARRPDPYAVRAVGPPAAGPRGDVALVPVRVAV